VADANVNTMPTILERDQRLSKSLLWQLQRRYFEQQGIEAWRQGFVPHYITSNPFIAKAYAKVVFGFLQDWTDSNALDSSQPLYVVELGAGSGRFAYHFLQKFLRLLSRSPLKDMLFTYVMTDFSARIIDYWRTHPRLQPLAAAGYLDFARFDAEQPGDIHLLHGDAVLTAANPLVLLANYFFDSIPQDCFTFQNGALFETLATLSAPSSDPDLTDPALLNSIMVDYDQRPARSDYYVEDEFNTILHLYQQRLDDTTLLFPCVGLRCLRHFRALSANRLLLLSGDKGYSEGADLLGQGTPHIAVHGSFSMRVNYHALGEYTRSQGGQFLQMSHLHAHLNVTACLWGDGQTQYTHTAQAYDDAIADWGPDDFFTLKKGVEAHYASLTLDQILAYLRLSGWDSNIFLGCVPALLIAIETASERQKIALFQCAERVWETFYPIGEDRDLAFELAMLCYGMNYFAEALTYFQHSLELYGTDTSALYNMAMCHYTLNDRATAVQLLEQILVIESTFEPAITLLLKIEGES